MRASLLTIGDELLIGQVLNSNAQWIAEQLTDLGLSVTHHLTVGDDGDSIRRALDYLRSHCEVILIGGGLGPTHDDITMQVLSENFKIPLEYDAEWISMVEEYFKSRNRAMSENNKKQGYLLKGATRIDNDCGTAAGQFFKNDDIQYFVFPGVPHEMKSMMTRFILPQLARQQHETGEKILKRTLLTTGLGESALAQKCDSFVQKIRTMPNVTLAFLPSPTVVRLRLQMRASTPEQVRQFPTLVEELREFCGSEFYGFEPVSLEEVVIDQLKLRKETLALAESCTGGLIAHRVTQVPGASSVFRGGLIPYQTEMKTAELGIPADFISSNGIVSEAVAKAMAENVRKKFETHYGVSSTGYIGPTGGDEHAIVGTVCIAVASGSGVVARTFHFENDRERSKERAAQAALDLLRRQLPLSS